LSWRQSRPSFAPRLLRTKIQIEALPSRHYAGQIDKNGGEMWTEVKGFETRDWQIHWKLFEALHTERDKRVIKYPPADLTSAHQNWARPETFRRFAHD
jgi:hypothetical protein